MKKHNTTSIRPFMSCYLYTGVLLMLLLAACSSKQQELSNADVEETQVTATSSNHSVISIAFYNVENLFDIEDDPNTDDNDFLPSNSEKPWTAQRYETKVKNLAEVISQLGDPNGPELIGLCEVENEAVLQQLIQEEKMAGFNYGIVHFESPDGRGIDNALLYKKDCFKVEKASVYALAFPSEPNYKSRDLLLVQGSLFGESLSVIVNHWPSRRGGEKESEPRRLIAANRARGIVDRLQNEDPNAQIILMGDFNDEPANKSIREQLLAIGQTELSGEKGELINAMYALDQRGKGSYNYRGQWNMLDQIIFSPALIDEQGLEYIDASATVFSPEWLKQQSPPKYKGSPLRTFGGRKYLGGYSDHFPVFINLKINQ